VEGVDLKALRTERLERLQAAMRGRDVDGCLFFHESNIRYATGASAMPVWNMTSFVRCAVVPAEGVPILFEHGNSIHRSRLAAADVRPFHQWEFYDDVERRALLDHRWWTLDELANTDDIVYPRELPDVVKTLLDGRIDRPLQLEDS